MFLPFYYRLSHVWVALTFAILSNIGLSASSVDVFEKHSDSAFSPLSNVDQPPPLLVLLIDSLRWDLVHQFEKRTGKSLPGFSHLKTKGFLVERVTPVFPAECYPNLISLLTGLYPVEHGALFTSLYDQANNETFHPTIGNTSYTKALSVLNSKFSSNNRLHLYHLPVCSDVDSDSVRCTAYSAEQMNSESLYDNLKVAVSRLSNGSSSVAVVYYDRLDQIGHLHGPLSDEILLSELPSLDEIIVQLIEDLLPSAGRDINLMLTADHGMTSVRARELLDRYISPDLVHKVINRGSTVSIWPAKDQFDKLQSRLNSERIQRFSFHTSTQLPPSWRSGGSRFPPILLVAKPGVIIDSSYWPIQSSHYPPPSVLRGAHGYDVSHKDMHVPLFIWGPQVHPELIETNTPWDQVRTHQLIMALTRTQSVYGAPHAALYTYLTMLRNGRFPMLLVFCVIFVFVGFCLLAFTIIWRVRRANPELEEYEKLVHSDLITA